MGLAAERLLVRYLPADYATREPEKFAQLERSITLFSVESYVFTPEALNRMRYDERLKIYWDRISGAKWAVIPGAAHLPNFEKPEAFNEALAGFLGAF